MSRGAGMVRSGLALQALLLLCVSSSCSPHDAASRTPARVSSPPLGRLYLDYHRVAGEELRASAAGAAAPGRTAGRRRVLSSSAHDAAGPWRGRGALAANASAGGRGGRGSRGAPSSRGAGQRHGKRRAGAAADELGVAGRVRSRPDGARRQRRGRGRAAGVVVMGAGLEEAVMGEPAEVTVEVSGWSQVREARCRCSASLPQLPMRLCTRRDTCPAILCPARLRRLTLAPLSGRAPKQPGAAESWRYG